MMLKRLTLTGSTLRSRSVAFKREVADGLIKDIWPLLESRTVQPIIYKEVKIILIF